MTSLTGSRGPTGGNVGPTASAKWAGDKIPRGYKMGQIAQYTPEQSELFSQSLGNAGEGSYLSRLAGGDQSLFDEMEAPALKQFAGLQGNLASRFSGMGSGARRSSGFQNTVNQAATDFAGQLQSQRQGLQRQAISDLHTMSQQLLSNRPYERSLIKKQESPWAGLVGQLGGAVPGLITSALGGGSPQSAIQGATSIFGGGGGWGTAPAHNAPLTQGYNQELRMNPAAYGY